MGNPPTCRDGQWLLRQNHVCTVGLLQDSLQEGRWLAQIAPQEEGAWNQQLLHLLGTQFSL